MSRWDKLLATTAEKRFEIVCAPMGVFFFTVMVCLCSILDPTTLHKVMFEGKTMQVAVHTKERVVTYRYMGMMPADIFEKKNGDVWFQCITPGSPAGFGAITRPASSEEVKLFRTFYK